MGKGLLLSFDNSEEDIISGILSILENKQIFEDLRSETDEQEYSICKSKKSL